MSDIQDSYDSHFVMAYDVGKNPQASKAIIDFKDNHNPVKFSESCYLIRIKKEEGDLKDVLNCIISLLDEEDDFVFVPLIVYDNLGRLNSIAFPKIWSESIKTKIEERYPYLNLDLQD